ncbi:MAG: hypothetical protein ACRDRI_12380 [Pseudonocardiaceae bacterium]
MSCLRWTERGDTGEVAEPPPEREDDGVALGGPGRWARSPLEYHAHLLLSKSEHPSGVLTARSCLPCPSSRRPVGPTPRRKGRPA